MTNKKIDIPVYHLSNKSSKSSFRDYLSRKLLALASTTGIMIIISLPVMSQSNYYPPMAFFQPLAYPNYPQRNEQGDLVASLEGNNNLKILLNEIETAGLSKQLRQGEFTILAPRDEAFNALSNEAFDKFSQPENRIKVLHYHLIPGTVTQEDLDRGEIMTLGGKKVTISQENNALKLNNSTAVYIPTKAKNGAIIEIDKVLFPSDF